MKTTLIYWYTVKELINSIQNEFFFKKIIGFKKRKNICQTHCEFPYICIQTIYFTNKIDRVCILKSQESCHSERQVTINLDRSEAFAI